MLALRLTVLLLAAPCQAHADSVTLVADGAPGAAIVIANDAPGCVPYAAEELQRHVERMSGARLPIVTAPDARKPLDALTGGKAAVLVGRSAYTRQFGVSSDGLAPDGFRIRTQAGRLVIVGRDDRAFGVNFRWTPASAGTLYGVYRLLERLGVRWFYPTELGTVIPKSRRVAVGPLSVTDEPYFAYRHTGYGDAKAFAWYRRIGAGGDRDVWSTRHTYESIGFHRKYGASHPEYFVVGADGRRGKAVALAHPGVVEATIREAKAHFAKQKTAGRKYFLVIPADGRACCQCRLCQGKLDRGRGPEGDMSDYVAEAAVAVAKGVAEACPEGRIVYCAYNRYKLTPRKIAKLPANMVVLIAQARREFHSAAARKQAYELVRAWRKLAPEAIYFCRYYNSMLKMTPSLVPHLIADDMRELKRISESGAVKLRGEMNFCGVPADSPYAWWHQLNEYVTARLLWRPDLDVGALLADYCEKLYGPGAEPMRRLLARCEALYGDDRQRDLYTVETIDSLDSLLRDARQRTQGTVFGKRLGPVERGFELLAQMRRKLTAAEPRRSPGDGLVLHLPMDEGRGERTRDAVRRKWCAIENARWTRGVRGRGLELSGEQSAVRIDPLSLAETDYTIMAWVRPAEIRFSGEQYIVGPSMWGRGGLAIRDGRLELFHRSPATHRLAAPAREFTDATWFHLAGTFSRRDGMALYVNGQLVAMDTRVTQASKYPVVLVGASGDGRTKDPRDLAGCLAGAVDDVRVYSRELSYQEIRELAQRR